MGRKFSLGLDREVAGALFVIVFPVAFFVVICAMVVGIGPGYKVAVTASPCRADQSAIDCEGWCIYSVTGTLVNQLNISFPSGAHQWEEWDKRDVAVAIATGDSLPVVRYGYNTWFPKEYSLSAKRTGDRILITEIEKKDPARDGTVSSMMMWH